MDIYNKAVGFAAVLQKTTKEFPRNTYYLVNQLNKAAGDIPSKIAAANSHYQEAERKDFFWDARGSLQNCSELVEVAARQGFIDFETRNAFRSTLNDLSSALQDLIRNIPLHSHN